MIHARRRLGIARYPSGWTVVLAIGLALAALTLLARPGAAQAAADAEVTEFTVYGVVVDGEGGEPLAGAWVGLQGTDWGSITDSDGRFRLPGVTAGPLALKVERLGYEATDWTGDIQNEEQLVRIALLAQPILLEGLEVVTDRFRARRNAAATSSLVYDAGDLATAGERTALEFVDFRSFGTEVACEGRRGNRCLYLRGRVVEPVVYVDEMPFPGGMDYLETFAPWEFHMIEIYGGGRHIRAYTPRFMKYAAERRLSPIALFF